MTLLSRKAAEAEAARKLASVDKTETMLSRARAATPRGELVTMPMLGRVWVELAGEMVVDEIEGAVYAAMDALKIPATALNGATYESRRAALTLAWAVRDPDSREVRAGTTDQWLAMDLEMIAACSAVYTDVRERLNPLSFPLSEDEFTQIRLAHEKKNPVLLRTFGVVSLSSYLATTDAPPASSPTTPLSDGPSAPGTTQP